MTPNNEPPKGFGWTCPSCQSNCRGIDFLCTTCFAPRPLIPDAIRNLLPTFDWEKNLIPHLDNLLSQAGKHGADVFVALEPALAKLVQASQQWVELLPKSIDSTSPQAQQIIKRLTTLFDNLLPIVTKLVERLQPLAPDPVKIEAHLKILATSLQTLIDRIDRLTNRNDAIEMLRQRAALLLQPLLAVMKRR